MLNGNAFKLNEDVNFVNGVLYGATSRDDKNFRFGKCQSLGATSRGSFKECDVGCFLEKPRSSLGIARYGNFFV